MEIKETKELLEGLGKVAVAAKKIAANGKIDASDLIVLIDLAKDIDALSESVKGVKEIPSELKDLDQAEVLEIIAKLYSISEDISKA
jgi:hypothetical protein